VVRYFFAAFFAGFALTAFFAAGLGLHAMWRAPSRTYYHVNVSNKSVFSRIRLVFLISCAACLGQGFEAAPRTPRQGETIRLHAPSAAMAARMAGRTVPLFPEPDGRSGLMPVPVGTAPGEYSVEFLDGGGAALGSATVTVRDARFPVQSIVLRKETAELKPSPGEMETMAAFRNTVTEVRYWREPLAAPVAGCMVSRFGVKRRVNGRDTGNFHGGIDQRAAAGRPIRAAADGMVRVVRQFNVHGGTVAIDHGQGLQSMYLHMSGFAVQEGTRVEKGDVIGYVGSTGRSTAPHLHWSLYVNGVPVNPLQWVRMAPCGAGKPKVKR
jgi:hypothetical protein